MSTQKIINLLEKAQKKNPHQRFLQLITNLVRNSEGFKGDASNPDLFCITDSQLIQILEEHINGKN